MVIFMLDCLQYYSWLFYCEVIAAFFILTLISRGKDIGITYLVKISCIEVFVVLLIRYLFDLSNEKISCRENVIGFVISYSLALHFLTCCMVVLKKRKM